MTQTRTITIERTFEASIEDVWALWTTRDGIESWWGPDGFAVTVHELDLRVGGELRYAMTATAPAMVEFMQKEGMPLSNELRATYTEIVDQRRLCYTNMADFVPDIEPYVVATAVEFEPGPLGVRMLLTIDAMHDELWTERAVMGWQSELTKLENLLATRES
jgi:uncharacterized protein YndB with AHSA1/START domain